MNSTAVVILNYNGENLLRLFLPSVVKFSPNASVIVADNGSTDNSIEVLQKEFSQVRLIKLEKNFGFCEGYNRALKQVKAKYYVLLNSDVEVTAGWLNPMLELLEKDPSVAATQPKILSYHNRDYFEYAGAAGGFIDSLGYPFCRGRLFNFTEKDTGQYNDQKEIFWATGACLLIRSEVYNQLGGLDETFFAHMEEIDLCWRIQRSGGSVSYCGTSTVYHVGAGTLRRSNPLKTYFNFRNALCLICYHLPGHELFFKLPIRIALDYMALLKFLFSGSLQDPLAVLKAHFYVVLSLGRILKKRKDLRKAYPYTKKCMYPGSIVLLYYFLGKRVISM